MPVLLSQIKDSTSYSRVSPYNNMCHWVQQGKVPKLESLGLSASLCSDSEDIILTSITFFTLFFLLVMVSQAENVTWSDFCYLVCQTKTPFRLFICTRW